jgi:thiol-disulfide isomerase/thioredoxin
MPGNRKSRSKKIASPTSLILTGAGLIIIAITVFITASWKPSPALGVGPVPGVVNYLAPDLELVDLSEVPVSLENLSGQVVLVNNWATWCPPCRAEMPELEAYYRDHQDEGFILVGINSGDRQDQVDDFIREYDLTFPIWLDPTGLALRVFQNNALPSSYVIDKSGVVRLIWMGAVSLEALENYVTPLFTD